MIGTTLLVVVKFPAVVTTVIRGLGTGGELVVEGLSCVSVGDEPVLETATKKEVSVDKSDGLGGGGVSDENTI